ncbi:hypothetical protein AU468_10820 [Alkalispirochaeta sphaeroplastigenens]|uniref:ABC transporter substrate-binding protein n=1 Tax=Alkalispirochaeta sphaeroplastigenens TaxID=1187066 RepID=A0A2S4JI47_9SPIO|nr:hypothetical protein [Alkalispirochaeta sphaeroplastigenens]POQ99100.1 hypothetical protein AU468_10820 [Alkalispirochaeta sphaeroplastigenens]
MTRAPGRSTRPRQPLPTGRRSTPPGAGPRPGRGPVPGVSPVLGQGLALGMILGLTLTMSLTLGACSSPKEPLTLWSNHTDAALLAELYRHETGQPLRFRYVNNLTEALTHQRVDADVVIGQWVNNPPTQAVMRPGKDQSPWTPLAFNLGAVVFERSHARITEPFALTPRKTATALHPGPGRDRQTPPLKFVPTSDPRFLYEMARIEGMIPEPHPSGGPRWQADPFDTAFSAIREFQGKWSASPREEQAYRARFLYEPWYRQLEDNRVLAVYLPSTELFDWSFFSSDSWDFRWLRREDGSIPVLEDLVYGGITAHTPREARARAFLEWVRSEETQKSLIEYKIDQRVDTFGFFGGFSTLTRVNLWMTRTFYPDLAGRVPEPETLHFPGPRPRYWDEARQALVLPFLLREADREANQPPPNGTTPGERLGDLLRRWYDQRGD